MFVASARNTEMGIAIRNAASIAERRRERQRIERELYEAKIDEDARIAMMKRLFAERRALLEQQLREQGIPFQHTYSAIERRACRVFHVKPVDIRSARRDQHLVLARQFVMYWTARLCGYSYPQLGRLMGGRDHTTCLHGVRKYPEKRAHMGRYLKPARTAST